ncbi:phosphoribosylamine--glycine ligase [Weissella viridescens]|uniref:phosphoribosylamine--glycine ligase n=1 Tax=Weissella viridescens TaxID=1629 RepID=UPI001D07917E|nr:phosphoribosylamine--glycine ligase [Weissella viridescens]MCB6839573.1 phosphoribosylamine--glycine ligase [Weissella viridescens]MCB6846304.1 phosphoribosylamine--glycine ligase [Weissella viridescens]
MTSVLIIGSGAREFIFAKTFAQSVDQVFVAPGNAGMREAGYETVNLTDIPELITFAQSQKIDLTFVGSEALLTDGIVDAFQAAGLPIFGPTKSAAQLEGSKAFTKALLQKYDIPTADSVTVTNLNEAKQVLNTHAYPVVVKLDGLALGKGVSIYEHPETALAGIENIYEQDAQAPLVIEEFMQGPEFSIFSFVGKEQVVHAPIAQDHKRLLDGDRGPNTGGMGAYSPVRWIGEDVVQTAITSLVEPVLAAMRAEGTPFEGILYTGVMLTEAGPKVIEYNVRFGDPEAQVVLPQLTSDLYTNIMDLLAGTPTHMTWQDTDVYLGVTLAAPGYPVDPEKGLPLPALPNDVQIDYAGVKQQTNQLVSNGGRVLTAVIHRPTMVTAQTDLYAALDQTHTDLVYRHDIGHQAVVAELAEE